ncbi:MAG: TfoX/Sxy family protein [Thermoplasmatota archaeon]
MTSGTVEILEDAATGLPNVVRKRMFSGDALFAGRQIFAIAWNDQIVLRLPDADAHAELLARPGASGWHPLGKSGKPMAHWVLVPDEMHDEAPDLRAWLKRAHALAVAGVGATKRSAPAAKTGPKTQPRTKTANPERNTARVASSKRHARGS